MQTGCLFICALVFVATSARSVRDVKDDATKGTDSKHAEELPINPPEVPKIQCDPVVCDPSCREAVGQFGCPVCLCGVLCSPPKCDPGCRIDYAAHPCPACDCGEGEAIGESQNATTHLASVLLPPKCQCDFRYFRHYETKKCKPVFEEGCHCPVRYECPEPPTTPDTACEYKGKTFQIGEDIKTSSSCEICSCSESYHGGAEVSCISVECPSGFRPPPPEGCFEVYQGDECCSFDIKCENETQGNVTEITCEYDGRTYQKGQRIYPNEDPCMSCLCDEDWSGPGSSGCKIYDCALETKLYDLRRGCIPIYHEKTCCPIETHCGDGNLNDTLIAKSGGACVFDGKAYTLGEELDINHPTNCVTCTCNTPPEFTCVHRSCPRPPNDDYDNCRPNYQKGECCPTYECLQPQIPIACAPVKCVNGCKEVLGPHGCSLCLCDTVLCAPPDCPDACDVEYDVPAGSCPRCKCPITVQFAPAQCSPVKCDPQCFEAVGPDGCPMCLCGPLCSPPKCEDGCFVQTDVSQGQCPGCVCPGEEDGLFDGHRIQCAPVICGPACREATGQYGCPTCLCDPLCSPPKCDPGCEIEAVPSSGPCPGCVCGERPTHNVQCAPVKCAPMCREAIGQYGCPTCMCDPLCSPPKCDPGCEVEYVPSSGPCPGCVCKDSQFSGIQCAPVKCAPTCREAIGQFGCPTCLCDPQCSPPKCDPGCEVETVPSSGPCPGCVCADKKAADIQCAPVKCGPTCREATGQFGCPMCLCDPLCSPPKCDPGCEVETVPSSGPCPGCVCGGKRVSNIQCAPVKCGPLCREETGESGCPTCHCDPLCSPPKCDPGCEVETVPSSGPCPGCVCGEKKGRDVQCAPVKCGPQCREAQGQFGCPVCLCDPLCSPPKCDPGCEVEAVPSSGPCPGCVCKSQPGNGKIQCAPVKCGPGCREAVGQFGCATCLCDPACSPPKCDPGCKIEVVPSLGPCPGCVCDDKKGQSRSRRDVWNGYYIYA